MAAHPMSDKEQALIDAARRELAGKPSSPPAAARLRAAPAAPVAVTTPLDQPTVLGWDHPEAQQPGNVNVAPDKWAEVAALMEAERRVEAERRARLRRHVTYVLAAIAIALLVGVVMTLRR